MENSFGESLLSPQLFLNQTYLFVDEKFDGSVRRGFRENLKVQSFFAEQTEVYKAEFNSFFTNPNLSAAFIVFPQNLKQLVYKKIISEKDFKELSKLLKKDKHLLYVIKRNENAYNFVIIAENDETAKKLIKDLADSPKLVLGEINLQNQQK